MRGWAKIGVLGALGLVAAAVLAALSMQLVSQPVGLSSEPLTAGNRLAPAEPATKDTGATKATGRTHATGKTQKPPTTTAATGTKPSPPRGDDDYSGSGDDSRPENGDGGEHDDD